MMLAGGRRDHLHDVNPTIYDALHALVNEHPNRLDWLKLENPAQRFLILVDFKTQNFLKYRGREIAIFGQALRSYYRLPCVGGVAGGPVSAGEYFLKLYYPPNPKPWFAWVNKSELGNLELREFGSKPFRPPSNYVRVQTRYFNFDEELVFCLRRYLEFYVNAPAGKNGSASGAPVLRKQSLLYEALARVENVDSESQKLLRLVLDRAV